MLQFNRIENSLRNLWWGSINKIICLIVPFILRTVIINSFGAKYIALSGLFSSILQVLNLAELGISSAIVYSLYKPIAENDQKIIGALLKFIKSAYRVIGLIILIFGISLLPLLNFFIHGEAPSSVNIYLLYMLYLVNTILSYFLYAYKQPLVIAYQRNDVLSNINTLVTVIKNILQIFAILVLKNYYYFVAASIFGTIINNLLVNKITCKLLPQCACDGELDAEFKKDLKKRVCGLLITKLSQVSRNMFDNIFISIFVGLTAVAMYDSYMVIMFAVIGILAVFSQAIGSGIGNSIVVENIEKNYSDFKKLVFMYGWIAGVSTICFICLYQDFIKLWLGESMLLDVEIMYLFPVYFYILAMGDIQSIYYTSCGLWWKGRSTYILEMIGNFVLNLLLTIKFGIFGVLVATCITVFWANIFGRARVLFSNYFGVNRLKEYYIMQIRYVIITIINSLLIYNICETINVKTFVGFFLKTMICIFLANVFYLVVYHRYGIFRQSIIFLKNKVFQRSN